MRTGRFCAFNPINSLPFLWIRRCVAVPPYVCVQRVCVCVCVGLETNVVLTLMMSHSSLAALSAVGLLQGTTHTCYVYSTSASVCCKHHSVPSQRF